MKNWGRPSPPSTGSYELFVSPPRAPSHPRRSLHARGVNVPVALWLASSFELFVPPPRAPSHPRRSLQAMGVAVSDALWLDHDLLWLVYEGVGEGEV